MQCFSQKSSTCIEIKQSFLRDHQERKDVKLKWVQTVDQLADILTKPLAHATFKFLRDQILVDVTAIHNGQ